MQQRHWDVHLTVDRCPQGNRKSPDWFNPNFIVFNREVTQPVDIILGLKEPGDQSDIKQIAEYVKDLCQSLQEIHGLARENIGIVQSRLIRDCDLNTFQKTYRLGDVILKRITARKIERSLCSNKSQITSFV